MPAWLQILLAADATLAVLALVSIAGGLASVTTELMQARHVLDRLRLAVEEVTRRSSSTL